MPADEHKKYTETFGLPDRIVLQLSHKDVNLGFFKPRKNDILALRAGQPLRYSNNYLHECTGGKPVAQLSQKMQLELSQWAERGYIVDAAFIRFIVAWRPKNAPREEKDHAVLLIDLHLKKLQIN